MKKRTSTKEGYFETIRGQNQSLGSPSPVKAPLHRQNTCTNFRKEKPLVELPKIYPFQAVAKHKRYLESCVTHEEGFLNLIGMKFNRKKSKESKRREESVSTSELKRERPLLERQQTQKQLFLEQILISNGIGKIMFHKKQKLKVFVNDGNNSRLINELMRRRVNLKITDIKEEANIVWTQNCDWQLSNKGSIFTESLRTSREISSTQYSQPADSNKEDGSWKNKKLKEIIITEMHLHNHLKNHFQISDKKCLSKNIKKYCKTHKIQQHQIIPITYHVEHNLVNMPDNFCKDIDVWIVKPGEDTNRGRGISVQIGRDNIVKAVKELATLGKSAIVQEYIDPLLYKNRKFDIRCYALLTSFSGHLKAYWYKQGYLRTCCKEFNYDPENSYGHLTNDAVQKKHKDYGKYEPYNKLSFTDLEILLRSKEFNYDSIINRMKELARISIKSAQDKLRGDKNMFAFEVFGFDFLIDSKGKVWLIQINTNPCLEFSGSLLSRIIWHMMENSFAIAIDPLLMTLPENYSSWREKMDKIYQDSKFQCIL